MPLGLLESHTDSGHLNAGRQGPRWMQPGVGTERKEKWERQWAQADDEVSMAGRLREERRRKEEKKRAKQCCVLRLGKWIANSQRRKGRKVETWAEVFSPPSSLHPYSILLSLPSSFHCPHLSSYLLNRHSLTTVVKQGFVVGIRAVVIPSRSSVSNEKEKEMIPKQY